MVDNAELREAVDASTQVIPIVKARLIGGEAGGTQQIDPEQQDQFLTQHGAIEPPYDPELLCLLHEHSNSLRQNIDAYATNIDAFGHRFEPVLDFGADDVDERLSAALQLHSGKEPTPEELEKTKVALKREMRVEKLKLESFFDFCCPDMSFTTLRRQTRQDTEVMGNGYWEVLRDNSNAVSQFVFLPGHTVRILPFDKAPVEVTERVPTPDFRFRTSKRAKQFRRYVQMVQARAVFFKEFGDPRVVSANTGRTYETEEALRDTEGQINETSGLPTRQATELLHWDVHSPRTVYGVPRWIGTLLAVMGSRQSEEVNFLYFENKAVPPMAVLVSGGRITESSVERIRDYVENHLKGKRNFHKILVLEAEPAQGSSSSDASSRMKITLQPLASAQQKDALFQNYDERNIDKVGQSFRLPRLLRGDIRDFNRSTALAALQFTEMQVFGPEREEFDFVINRKILAGEMGIKFWKFKSQSPVTRDPQVVAEVIKNLANAGVITPEEGRELTAEVFNRDFKKIDQAWVRQPMQLTLAGIDGTGEDRAPGGAAPPPKNNVSPDSVGKLRGPLRQVAKHLLQLRGELSAAEAEETRQEYADAHDAEVERVTISEEEMRSLVEPHE
jgi:PBSX family phage portal protein